MSNGNILIEVRDLEKHFPLTKGVLFRKQVGAVRAVDSVSFDVFEGETLGLVGESGCGKSTTARLVTRLLEPTGGTVRYKGEDISHKSRNDLIGLNPEHYNRFPHEFSGGQRQRIGVARAIALKPNLVVADEPVSALDVSIQAQIINLLEELQDDLGLTIVFIAHDLSVVRHVCDRIAVMYLGKVVELADADSLFEHPRHPYTGALLSAVPVPDPRLARDKQRQVLGGDVPSPTNPPAACRFHTRCPKARDGHCNVEEPLLEAKEGGNLAACHYPLTDQEVAQRVPTAAA
jgi:peptide/nickel transport system ATP-binding protein/oligopeptide transport system ATP-binding protein